MLVISDSHGRCEHFEVYIDDRLIGETSGTGPLDFSQCGLPDECMEKNGGQHGYFALPRGKPDIQFQRRVLRKFLESMVVMGLTLGVGNYKLGLKWAKVTPECDRSSSGEGHYKFHRRC